MKKRICWWQKRAGIKDRKLSMFHLCATVFQNGEFKICTML